MTRAQIRPAGGLAEWACRLTDRVRGARPEGAAWSVWHVVGALLLAAAAIAMQGWMNAVDYPINVGGKPFFSWPAFVPITFELFVLFAALASTGLGIVLCGLFRWHSPLHDSGVMAEVTGRRFGLVIDAADERFSPEAARALLAEAGCADIRPVREWDEEDA